MTGRLMVDLILMGMSLLATLGTAGLLYYQNFIYQRPMIDVTQQEGQMIEEVKKSLEISGLKLEDMTFNISSRVGRLRFLDLSVEVMPMPGLPLKVLEDHKIALQDIFILKASEMNDDELNTVSGKLIFESRIKEEAELLFKRPAISRVVFTKFVIQ